MIIANDNAKPNVGAGANPKGLNSLTRSQTEGPLLLIFTISWFKFSINCVDVFNDSNLGFLFISSATLSNFSLHSQVVSIIY